MYSNACKFVIGLSIYIKSRKVRMIPSLSHQRFSDDRGGELYFSTAHIFPLCAVDRYNSPPLSSENLWWLRLWYHTNSSDIDFIFACHGLPIEVGNGVWPPSRKEIIIIVLWNWRNVRILAPLIDVGYGSGPPMKNSRWLKHKKGRWLKKVIRNFER